MQKSHKWMIRSLWVGILIAVIQIPVWAQRPQGQQRVQARRPQAQQRPQARRAQAQQRPRAQENRIVLPGGGPVNGLIRQVGGLDLSSEQSQALRGLVRRARARGQEVQAEVQAARQKLTQKALRGAEREALTEAADELSQALLGQAVFQARVSNAIRGELTQEQKAELRQRAQRQRQRARQQQQNQRQPRGQRQSRAQRQPVKTQ